MTMGTMSASDAGLDDARLLEGLRMFGVGSFDDLASALGMDWITVFSSVDRLTRSGVVVLRRIGREYFVAVKEG